MPTTMDELVRLLQRGQYTDITQDQPPHDLPRKENQAEGIRRETMRSAPSESWQVPPVREQEATAAPTPGESNAAVARKRFRYLEKQSGRHRDEHGNEQKCSVEGCLEPVGHDGIHEGQDGKINTSVPTIPINDDGVDETLPPLTKWEDEMPTIQEIAGILLPTIQSVRMSRPTPMRQMRTRMSAGTKRNGSTMRLPSTLRTSRSSSK